MDTTLFAPVTFSMAEHRLLFFAPESPPLHNPANESPKIPDKKKEGAMERPKLKKDSLPAQSGKRISQIREAIGSQPARIEAASGTLKVYEEKAEEKAKSTLLGKKTDYRTTKPNAEGESIMYDRNASLRLPADTPRWISTIPGVTVGPVADTDGRPNSGYFAKFYYKDVSLGVIAFSSGVPSDPYSQKNCEQKLIQELRTRIGKLEQGDSR